MAASVFNSPRAVETSIQVVRAFMRLRQMLPSNNRILVWNAKEGTPISKMMLAMKPNVALNPFHIGTFHAPMVNAVNAKKFIAQYGVKHASFITIKEAL